MSELVETQNPLNLAPIAHPLADKKLTKKLFKAVKKATKAKHIKRGVKEVVKALRKGEKGLVVLAGDISPIDVISHIPVMCEDAGIAYIYVDSKQSLGAAGQSKRPTSVMMIPDKDKKGQDYEEYMDSCVKDIAGLPIMPSVTSA